MAREIPKMPRLMKLVAIPCEHNCLPAHRNLQSANQRSKSRKLSFYDGQGLKTPSPASPEQD